MQTASVSRPPARTAGTADNVLFWVLQIALAGVFFWAGIPKLTGSSSWVQLFEAVGFGQWFRYFTGVLEVTGAILLLVPAFAGVGALLLSVVMVGAVLISVSIISASPLFAGVLLALLWFVMWGRRERTWALLGFRPDHRGRFQRG